MRYSLLQAELFFTETRSLLHCCIYNRSSAIDITDSEVGSIIRIGCGQDAVHLALFVKAETGKLVERKHPYIALCITICSGAKVLEYFVELCLYLAVLTRWNNRLHRFEVEHLRTFFESPPKALE